MNLRKNMVLVVGGAICLVLILAAAFMLFRYRSAYVAVRSTAQAAEARLLQLNQRAPFPSAENVEVAKANLAALDRSSEAILASLRQGQEAIPAVEAAEFAPMLEKAKQRLLAGAAGAGVKIPERFGLGFDRYTKGELPSDEAIPRLVTQLRASEAVLKLLFDARVTEISDLQREMFEGAPVVAATTDRRGAAPAAAGPKWGTALLAESNELFYAERIYVSCSAREAGVWSLLNTIAANRPLIVLADIKMSNPLGFESRKAAAPAAKKADAGAARGAAAGTATAAAKIPDREERVVAGREAIKVEMLLDVYRFSDGAVKQEGTP